MPGLDAARTDERDVLTDQWRLQAASRTCQNVDPVVGHRLGTAQRQADAVRDHRHPQCRKRFDVDVRHRLGDDLTESEAGKVVDDGRDLRAPADPDTGDLRCAT